ncbi:hypothetical protein AB8Z38_15570 [Bradyrhizobium sp. LLZ17]|uniref:Uncharacterized protein n=1 Tax=Bradyrhizobium sp. LLZ17 TaxID=3239388 RepID=A0AB39XWM2_9BRAD
MSASFAQRILPSSLSLKRAPTAILSILTSSMVAPRKETDRKKNVGDRRAATAKISYQSRSCVPTSGDQRICMREASVNRLVPECPHPHRFANLSPAATAHAGTCFLPPGVIIGLPLRVSVSKNSLVLFAR